VPPSFLFHYKLITGPVAGNMMGMVYHKNRHPSRMFEVAVSLLSPVAEAIIMGNNSLPAIYFVNSFTRLSYQRVCCQQIANI
jgi:hypothetical protein